MTTDVVELNLKAKPVDPFEQYLGVGMSSLFKKKELVGSFVTCNPPPDTDIDVLVLWEAPGLGKFLDAIKDGWEECGNYGTLPKNEFIAYRKGKINLIVCYSLDYYNCYLCARDICKALNLMDKKDRIKVHGIMFNYEPLKEETLW